MTLEIETIQNDLGKFIMSLCPVKWDKVYYYVIRTDMSCDMYFCVKEFQTGLIISSNYFFDRYDKYGMSKNETYAQLYKMTTSLYNAYKADKEKLWTTMTLIADSSGETTFDFTYEAPAGKNIFQQREEWEKKYFNEPAPAVKVKYPEGI
ncbi:MAG: DUF600 family protein [Oscillospiraceae bacterium]|nr:DUF600 family protein [Oscillospiraceae bacterium]